MWSRHLYQVKDQIKSQRKLKSPFFLYFVIDDYFEYFWTGEAALDAVASGALVLQIKYIFFFMVVYWWARILVTFRFS